MIELNITKAPVEQAGRTWSRTAPVKLEGVESTGVSNEYTYAGGFDALVEYAQEYINANAGKTLQVTATVRREAGGMAQLTLSTTAYKEVVEEEEEPEEGGGGTVAPPEEETGTEVSIEVSGSVEDILCHPRFRNVNFDTMAGIALQKLARGADPEEEFEWGGLTFKVGEQAANVDGWELVTRASSYYVPHVVATITDNGRGGVETVFTISNPPGLSTPGGYNWLSMGGGMQTVGGKRRRVRKYMLSGPGGWDPEIYAV